ncbi:testis-expressed protein 33 isoform X3 [Rhinatrema bivittatum]|uniref:testis-expressed protein 33 isoform X3 n=1 Tax=Rhinatrema bivittatum TaxID=194408 RepID=UPI001129B059|nr:testis-expressed protein 33 isoform X3 [Rhinatrema bivittatum]
MSANPSGANKCGSRLSGNTPDQCQDSMQRKKLTDSHLSRSHREQKTPRNSQCRLSCPSTNRMQTGSPPKGNDPNSMKNGSKQTKQDSEGKPCDLDKPGSSTDRSAAGLQSPTGSCRIEEAQNKVAEETQISSASVSDPGTSNDKLEVSQAQPEAESTERVVVIIPDFRMKEGLMGSSPHACYYELGHCLRANIFPGVPTMMKTLVQDSYTKEVNQLSKIDMRHWHGKRSDEIAKWNELHFRAQNVKKAFEQKQQEKNPKS